MTYVLRTLAAAAVVAAAATAPAEVFSDEATIPLLQFVNTNPVVSGYGPIRATYNGAAWILQPNAETPGNTLGWLNGPLRGVSPATDALAGNVANLRITFSFDPNYTGTPPEVRFRMNTSDFQQYSATSITQPRFEALRNAGARGTVLLQFDRQNITSDTNVQIFVDLFNVGVTNADPNFTFRLEKVEYFTSVSNSAWPRKYLVTAAYLEKDGDLYAHLNGSTSRSKLRETVDSYAYDGPYVVAVDNGRIYGYSALKDFDQVTIDDNNVVSSAAISDQHVLWLEEDGDLKYYNFETGTKRNVADSDEYLYVSAGSDGVLYVIQRDAGEVYGRIRQYDPRLSSPALTTILDDHDGRLFNSRMTYKVDDTVSRFSVDLGLSVKSMP